jgi:hypothetical protein
VIELGKNMASWGKNGDVARKNGKLGDSTRNNWEIW